MDLRIVDYYKICSIINKNSHMLSAAFDTAGDIFSNNELSRFLIPGNNTYTLNEHVIGGNEDDEPYTILII